MSEKNQHANIGDAHNVSDFTGSYAAFADTKLVEMTRSGDDRAFECLMRRHLPVVNAYLWGKMWERAEIADLAQEIFIRAYTKIGQLHDTSKFSQWLLRIARHAWADYCRSPETQHRKKHLSLESDEVDIGRMRTGSNADPARSAAQEELQHIVQLAIGELKERYRLILYLRLIDEKSNKEIAQLTGLKENAVRTRFSRGLDVLRKSLIKKGLGSW